jgi:hypothetical protein
LRLDVDFGRNGLRVAAANRLELMLHQTFARAALGDALAILNP